MSYSMNPRFAITQATQVQMRARGGWEYTQGKADKHDKNNFKITALQRMKFSLPNSGTRSPKRDNESEILDTLLAGRIIDRMDKQPEPIKSWLWFAYGAWFYKQQQQRLVNHLVDSLYHGDSEAKKDKFQKLARLSIFDYRQRVWELPSYRKVLIFSTCGINKQAYFKYWNHHYRDMLKILEECDFNGICAIAEVLIDHVGPMQGDPVDRIDISKRKLFSDT